MLQIASLSQLKLKQKIENLKWIFNLIVYLYTCGFFFIALA